MSGPTSSDRRTVQSLGVFAGIFAGLLAFVFFPKRSSADIAPVSRVIAGSMMALQGTWVLFSRAAFPERFRETGPDRLRQAVIHGCLALVGLSQLISLGPGLALLAVAGAGIACAGLRYPKRFFATAPDLSQDSSQGPVHRLR